MTDQQIKEIVLGMDDGSFICLWNDFCMEYKYFEEIIYPNDDDFLENHFEDKAELAKEIEYGDYKWSHNYAVFGIRLNSFDTIKQALDNDFIDIDDLIEWLQQNNYYKLIPYGIDIDEEEEDE